MKNYYDEEDDITLYWELRYQEWLKNPNGPDWGVFENKDSWFEERFSHIIPKRTPVGRVLEVGCGNAMYSVPLLRRFESYTGFDTSPTALKIAEIKLGIRPDMNLFLVTPDQDWFGDSNKLFDGVVSITVLQHQPIPRRLRYIEQIKRLLKPGGIYIGLEMQGNTLAYDMPPFPTEDWIKAWEPMVIVKDHVPEHPYWDADNVWVARR